MDKITVRVPAQPQYVQIARLISAGLAARLGFTIDDIEDLKIAVDELAAYLTGAGGQDGTVEFEFDVFDDRIEIRGIGHFAGDVEVRTDLSEFSRMILDTVTDGASLEQADGIPTFKLVKSKAS